MRKIVSLMLLTALFFNVKSQDTLLIDNFENELKKWAPVNDNNHVVFEIVDNPLVDSNNPTNKVLRCVRKKGSVSWAGVILRNEHNVKIDTDFDGYCYASVKYLKKSTDKVSFKIENGPNNSSYESTVNYPDSDNWVTVEFNLKGAQCFQAYLLT